MKRLFVLFIVCMLGIIKIHANIVTASSSRLSDNSLHNASQTDVILSKVCELDTTLQESFDSTFTLLVSIEDKACSIESKTDFLIARLNETYEVLGSVESAIDSEYNVLGSVITLIDTIQVNDFGGTWTALDALNNTISSKLDVSITYLNTIESNIDVLSAVQDSHFVATFTLLQEISNNELDLLLELHSISDELITGLSQIDQCILIAKDIMTTIESSLDTIGTDIEVGFIGTYSVIEDLFNTACTTLNETNALETSIIDTIVATYTVLTSIEHKLCTIESTVDELQVDANIVDANINIVLNVVDSGFSKICVIDSKIDTIDASYTVIMDSFDTTDLKETTIASQLDGVIGNRETIFSKVCVLESDLDILSSNILTTISKVDIFDEEIQTIDSFIDIISIITLSSKVDVLQGDVNSITDNATTVFSVVDIIDQTRVTITSIVDVLQDSIENDIQKSCTIESFIDISQSKLDLIDSSLITIFNQVNTASSSIDYIVSNIDTVETSMTTIISKLDEIVTTDSSLLSKVCVLDQQISSLDSKIDVISSVINTDKNISFDLLVDMQETWTILDAINNTITTVIEEELRISSNLSEFVAVPDMSTVYTIIVELESKADSILNSSLSLESIIDAYNQNCTIDISETFTAMEGTLINVCSTQSIMDVLAVDIQTIIQYDGVGISIPIVNNLSDTFTISEPGRYSLLNDVPFSPGGNQCIYVDADDVHINLCSRIIHQTNSKSDVVAIRVANGRTNISINNGAIADFTSSAIVFEGNNNFIRMNNIRLIDNGSDQLSFNTDNESESISNVLLRSVMVDGANGNCIQFKNASGIRMVDCIAAGSTSNGGINMNACDYVVIKNCIMDNNEDYGFAGAVGSANNQPFGVTNFVLDSCLTMTNTTDGLLFNGFNKNGVIINCISEDNTYGIHFTDSPGQVNDSTTNSIVYNICSANVSHGIYIDANARNNFFAFNQMHANTGTTFLEDSGEGPNSILGNYAFRNTGTNYSGGATTINTSAWQNTGSFPGTEPTYWINVDVTT